MKAFQIVCSVMTGLAVMALGGVGAFVVPRFQDYFDEVLEGELPYVTTLVFSIPPMGYFAGGLVLGLLAAAAVASIKPAWASVIVAFAFVLLATLGFAIIYVALFLPLTTIIQATN